MGIQNSLDCKFRSDAPTFIYAMDGAEIGKGNIPLCKWTPEKAPPALIKVWGGAIDEKDCAMCKCFEKISDDLAWEPSK